LTSNDEEAEICRVLHYRTRHGCLAVDGEKKDKVLHEELCE